MELGPEDVSLLERCPHFRGCNVQVSMELGPEDVSLLERCPHFYVQASMELGPNLKYKSGVSHGKGEGHVVHAGVDCVCNVRGSAHSCGCMQFY